MCVHRKEFAIKTSNETEKESQKLDLAHPLSTFNTIHLGQFLCHSRTHGVHWHSAMQLWYQPASCASLCTESGEHEARLESCFDTSDKISHGAQEGYIDLNERRWRFWIKESLTTLIQISRRMENCREMPQGSLYVCFLLKPVTHLQYKHIPWEHVCLNRLCPYLLGFISWHSIPFGSVTRIFHTIKNFRLSIISGWWKTKHLEKRVFFTYKFLLGKLMGEFADICVQ